MNSLTNTSSDTPSKDSFETPVTTQLAINPLAINEGASVMQSERIFQQPDGNWYFRIRGNTTMGPYSTHREADQSLQRYTASCRRQGELSFRWPRWLHVRHWVRKVSDVPNVTANPRRA